MQVTTKITVDLTRPNVGTRVNAVQGDGNTRYVEITLLSGGAPWAPPEGVEAAIAYMQPGGPKGLYNKLADGTAAISISRNVATIILAPQMLTASGTVQASLVFNDQQLNRLTTFPFAVSVTSNPAAGAQKTEDYLRLQWLEDKLDEYLRKAADSGEFDGEPGAPGQDYVLTEADKIEIAEMAAGMVEVPDSGGNVDLTGYATEQFVRDGYQPKGNYLTEVPEGYAKTTDIPTKPEDIGALPDTYTPPNQTAEQVGADPKGTAASAVSQHNTADDSHNDIRLELKAINDKLTAFFDSDDQTLDELSEIVGYITRNKTLIESITTSKVSVTDIINNLTTNSSSKPLSAAQGVVLKGLIDTVSNSLASYQPKGDYALRSELPTVPTNVSAFTNDAGYLTEHQDISGKLDTDKLPEAVTEIIESLEQQEANLFSFKNAQTNLSRFSKNSSSTGYIYDQGQKYGYKDDENEYFVFTPQGNVGIVGGLSLPLNPGSYKLQVELYIPTTEDATRTKVYFGVYLAPSTYNFYANCDIFDLAKQGEWVKREKIFTVADDCTHVYPMSVDSNISTLATTFYARNICITSLTYEQNGIEGKKWVAIGDSHTEQNSHATKRYYGYIAEQTGIVVTVNGVGGSGYKAKEDVSKSYYQRVLDLPSDTEVVTLFTSNNDLSTGAEIGTYTDTTTDTICGCINKTIDNLFSVLPTVKLGVITNVPPQSYNPMSTSENANEKLAEAVVALCKRRGIPCLDLFHSSGLRPWDVNFRNLCYKHDPGQGHFDEDGHAFIAPRIKALLESIIM